MADDRTANRRLLTALQAMGYSEGVIGPFPDVGLSNDDFMKVLKGADITPEALDTALQLSKYKSGLGENTPPPAPPGISDLYWRGVVNDYETTDRQQTMDENNPDSESRIPAQDPNAGPAGTKVPQLGQLPTPPKPPPTPVAPASAPAALPANTAAVAPKTGGANAAPTDWAGKPIPKTQEELDDYIKANYGFAAMATSDPDIAKILHDSAVGGWSPDKTKGLISTTTWWKNHTDADRQWIDLEKTDPATAKKRQSMQLTDLQNIVSKSGEQVDPRRLELISNLSLRHGWSTGETAAALAAEYRYDPTGKVTGISADLKSQARNYATTLSDASFTQWGKQILAGTATMDTFKDYLSTQAKLLLPGMAAQIDQGFDVKTLVDPYMQRAAKLLDLDPNTMDFTDPKWLRFINARDAKGNVQPVNYADMEATIKTDPQYGWDKTKGAHEEAAQMSSTILSKFGMG